MLEPTQKRVKKDIKTSDVK